MTDGRCSVSKFDLHSRAGHRNCDDILDQESRKRQNKTADFAEGRG